MKKGSDTIKFPIPGMSIKLLFIPVILALSAITLSCMDMYGEMLDGTNRKLAVFVADENITQLWVLEKDGFESRSDLLPASRPTCDWNSSLVCDYDNDGDADLVLCEINSLYCYLLENRGGRFVAAGTFYTGVSINDMACGDFNNDGITDLYMASSSPGDDVIYSASGSLQSNFALAGTQYCVSMADFNLDGYPDIFVGADDGYQDFFVTWSAATGTYAYYQTLEKEFAATADSAAGDFNNDGRPDIFLIYSGLQQGHVFLNEGWNLSGAVTQDFDPSLSQTPMSVTSGDLNNDGYIDIFVSYGSNPTKGYAPLINNGNGSFTEKNITENSNSYIARLFDVDYDGDLDAVLLMVDGINYYLRILENNGNGEFSIKTTTDLGTTAVYSIHLFTLEN